MNKRIFKKAEFYHTAGFPLKIQRTCLDLALFPEHGHEFTELAIVLGGRGQHRIEGWEYELAAGDVFVFNPPHRHEFRRLEKLELVNVMFDPDLLLAPRPWMRKLPGYQALFVLEPRCRRQRQFSGHLRLPTRELVAVEALLAEMLAEQDKAAPGSEALIEAAFLRLVVRLAQAYERRPNPGPREIWRVAMVLGALEQDPAAPAALPELAAAAHMSVNNFLRVFRTATGYSPIDYLLRLRVRRAAELLRTTPLTVGEIADRSGFADSNYFARQFRRIVGQSPRTYRRGAEAD